MVGLVKYYRQSPDQLTQEQIRSYLLYLKERGVSPSSPNVAISGMKFFYHQILGWDEHKLFLPPRKGSWRLPEVLSPKEVERLLCANGKLRDRCLLMTAYATGVRGSELGRLKVSDIDSERMMVRVEQGKGGANVPGVFLVESRIEDGRQLPSRAGGCRLRREGKKGTG